MNPFEGIISALINIIVDGWPFILFFVLIIGFALIKDKIKAAKKRKMDKKRQREYEQEKKEELNSLIEKYGSDFGNLIFNEKIEIGMTKEMIDIVEGELSHEFDNYTYYQSFYGEPFNKKIKFKNKKAIEIIQIKDPFWLDMTKKMIIASWGEAEDEKKNVTKNGEKLKWYYGGRKTIQYTTRYKYEVKIEDGVVVGWKELE